MKIFDPVTIFCKSYILIRLFVFGLHKKNIIDVVEVQTFAITNFWLKLLLKPFSKFKNEVFFIFLSFIHINNSVKSIYSLEFKWTFNLAINVIYINNLSS